MSLPLLSWSVTERMCPSRPVWHSLIRAKGHRCRLTFSFLRRTIDPGVRSLEAWCHFGRGWSAGRYSLTQRFVHDSWRLRRYFCLAEKAALGGGISGQGSCGCCSDLPISISAGVRGTCSGSSTRGVKGRELICASIQVIMVSSSLSETRDCPSTFFKGVLTLFTRRSQKPPHHGAAGGLNCQMMSGRCFAAFVNVVALSEYKWRGFPLRLVKRVNADRNSSVERSFTISRWIPRVDPHVKRAIHRFSAGDDGSCLDLTRSGPAYSSPVWANGGKAFSENLEDLPFSAGTVVCWFACRSCKTLFLLWQQSCLWESNIFAAGMLRCDLVPHEG